MDPRPANQPGRTGSVVLAPRPPGARRDPSPSAVSVSEDGVQARTALGELTSDRASAAPEEAVSLCGARDPKPGGGIEQPSCMNATPHLLLVPMSLRASSSSISSILGCHVDCSPRVIKVVTTTAGGTAMLEKVFYTSVLVSDRTSRSTPTRTSLASRSAFESPTGRGF